MTEVEREKLALAFLKEQEAKWEADEYKTENWSQSPQSCVSHMRGHYLDDREAYYAFVSVQPCYKHLYWGSSRDFELIYSDLQHITKNAWISKMICWDIVHQETIFEADFSVPYGMLQSSIELAEKLGSGHVEVWKIKHLASILRKQIMQNALWRKEQTDVEVYTG